MKKRTLGYRLTFGGTRATKRATTLKQATKDAQYWVDYGQSRVCIDKKLPSGGFKRVRCLYRPGAHR
jgi:hypothetical protein